MKTVLPISRHLNRTFRLIPWGGGLLPLLMALFVLVRIGEAVGMAPELVRGYGDDLLCLPLVLSMALTARRLAGRSGCRDLPLSHGLMAVIFFGVFFEVLLPAVKAQAVGDPWDLLMYLAGFMIFQGGLNRCGPGETDRHSQDDFLSSPPNRLNLEETWTPLKPLRPADR